MNAERDPDILSLSDIDMSGSEREDTPPPPQDAPKKTIPKRKLWDKEETAELRKYFDKHLKVKTTPGKTEVERAIARSKKSGGELHKRYYHTIVKKISNMNKSAKK